jgi:hypothetical protein
MKPTRSRLKKVLRYGLLVLGGLFVAIQFVPYGRGHTNPPVVQEPAWESMETRQLAARACFACHSNETTWPWYSHVAPVSWLVQRHVDEGRRELNFSEWHLPQEEAHEAAETVLDGSMPPRDYALLHSSARLSAAEKQALARGLAATMGTQRGRERRHDDDD